MSSADYRLCDVCDGEVFYDACLNYTGPEREGDKIVYPEHPYRVGGAENLIGYSLGHLGDWAVLCRECAETHRTKIINPHDVVLTRDQLRDWLAYLQGGRIGPVTVGIEEALR